ncbi:hypothetical protein D3C76_1710740 [compost metagenome]
MEFQRLQGRDAEFFELGGVLDKAFRVRAKQGRREQSLAPEQLENVAVRQKEYFRAEAVGF